MAAGHTSGKAVLSLPVCYETHVREPEAIRFRSWPIDSAMFLGKVFEEIQITNVLLRDYILEF